MREIKYRGYSTKHNEMWDCNQIALNRIHMSVTGNGFLTHDEDGALELIDWLIPIQYTGLKDKNGKEIYEGDILRIKSRSRVGSFKGGIQKWGWEDFREWDVIVYCEPSTTLVKHLKTGVYCSHLITVFATARDCDGSIEIIGNVFENPDLLK